MSKHKVRIGDSVLVKCEVIRLNDSSTRTGIRIGPGGQVIETDAINIIEVEQAFRVGDRVRLLRPESAYNVGEISALSPAGHEPLQAWIKIDGQFPLATRDVRSLERLDS